MFLLKQQAKEMRVRRIRGLRPKIAKRLHWAMVSDEVLAGITVALALIPESLAFAAIAQVSPMVALYASFCMAVVISIAGGRPAMISAATGSMALLMTSLVANHGVEYLFAATILTGVIQFLIGVFKLGKFFNFLPPTVIAGFVNALGILIFIAQIQQLMLENWRAYIMVAITLAIVYCFPRLTQRIPSPLVAIIVMTIAAISMGLDVRRVGDLGEITRSLPIFSIPNISFSLETLEIILPYSLALAIVGLLESLLTASLVDDLTDTRSSKDREVRGQGIANIVTGFFGGMAGCGMVGQSVINVRSGGRGRLSTCVAGMFLLFAIFVLRDIVHQIPVAVLLGIMIMVAFETFDWKSLKKVRRMPWTEALVMPVTVAVVIWTHDLSKGVIAGLLMSVLVFGWQASQIKAQAWIRQDGAKVYDIKGQLFFGSVAHFIELFDCENDPDQVVINFSRSHIWDHSGAEAIAKVINHYHRMQKRVLLIELNSESASCISQFGLSEYIVHFASSSNSSNSSKRIA